MSIPWSMAALDQNAGSVGLVRVAANYIETAAQLGAITEATGSNQIFELADSNLDALPDNLPALQLATDGVMAGEIILALQQANISVPLFGQVDVGSPQVIQVAKAAANGLIFVSPGPAPQDVDAEAFTAAYQALAGFPPGPRAVLAYDAANVLLDSIERAMLKTNRRPTRLEVSAVITSIERQGLSGTIAFDRQGRRIDAPVWTYQISKEEYPGTPIAP
jgi:ABC-type branched-subunit amino acid transport system substrate-binding protein